MPDNRACLAARLSAAIFSTQSGFFRLRLAPEYPVLFIELLLVLAVITFDDVDFGGRKRRNPVHYLGVRASVLEVRNEILARWLASSRVEARGRGRRVQWLRCVSMLSRTPSGVCGLRMLTNGNVRSPRQSL